MLKCRDWKNIEDIEMEDIPKSCGVYKICITDSKGEPFPIGRFCKKDEKGTLMIGHSTDIKKRIKDFNDAKEKGHKHSEGNRLCLIKKVVSDFNRIYGNYEIKYKYETINGGKDKAKEREKDLLKHYFRDYGEVPPLNHVLPGAKQWLEKLLLPDKKNNSK